MAAALFTGEFTGAVHQKNSYNGQDHQRCGGKVWGLVNDGHGDRGKLASDFCAFAMEADINAAIEAGTLREFVAELPSYGPTLHERLRQRLFADADIFADENGVPKSSYTREFIRGGTTSTVVFHLEADEDKKQDEKIVFAWVGDSSGKIFLESEDGQVQVIDGTDDHSADNRAEYERLEARRQTGAVTGDLCYDTKYANRSADFVRMYGADGTRLDYISKHFPVERTTKEYHAINAKLQKDPQNEELHRQLAVALEAYQAANKEYKEWEHAKVHARLNKGTVKEDGYGGYLVGPDSNKYGKDSRLANTRAFGDFAGHQVGLTAEMQTKEFLVKDLPESFCRVIFVASDGVHDCYTDEELAKLVLSAKTDEQLLAEFVKQSRTLFGKQADDISFVRKFF